MSIPTPQRSGPHPGSPGRGLLGLGTRLVLLVVAAGVAVVSMRPELVWPSATHATATDGEDYTPALADFFWNSHAPDIDEIEVHRPGQPLVRLRRMDGQWRVLHGNEWLPAGADRTALLLHDRAGRDEIATADDGTGIIGQFQGANPANHDRSFAIGDAVATRVRFLRLGEPVEDLLLGRTIARAEGPGTFVRRLGSAAVYLVPGDLNDNFTARTTSEWLMGRVFAGVAPDTIQRIAVEGNEQGRQARYTLVRDGLAGWTVEIDGHRHAARPSLVDAVLASLEAMDSLGVVESHAASADGSVARVRVDTNDGQPPRVLLVGGLIDGDSARHTATISGSPHPFALLRPHALLRDGAEFVETRAVAQAGQNRLARP